MKRPLRAIIGSILGVTVAGVPLFYFATQPGETNTPRQVAEGNAEWQVPSEIRCTGIPDMIIIREGGRELCRITPEPSGYWYGTLPLPVLRPHSVLELEVETNWTAPRGNDQVLSLELLPPGLPARRDTQWADAGTGHLHAVFLYRW